MRLQKPRERKQKNFLEIFREELDLENRMDFFNMTIAKDIADIWRSIVVAGLPTVELEKLIESAVKHYWGDHSSVVFDYENMTVFASHPDLATKVLLA